VFERASIQGIDRDEIVMAGGGFGPRKPADALKFTETSGEAVRTAEATVATATEQAAAEHARGGCEDLCRQREEEERNARAALLLAQQNRAATLKAGELDAQIAKAEAALNAVDRKEAVKESDPQSASMAKAIGTDQNSIAALSQAFFVIAIEFESGVGFWLVFGRAAPGRLREVDPSSTEVRLVDPSPAQKLFPVYQKPGDIIERFFLEVVRPLLNGRVRSLAMWEAYVQWCSDRKLEAVSHAMFGRLARWHKDRIGGAVWYLDCELAEG
jgi:hypothetical protein